MSEITLLDQELVKQVQWTGDSEQYDLELQALGPEDEPFIIINPWISDSRPFYFIEDFPQTRQCIVWTYQGEWVAKMFPPGWTPSRQYLSIEIELPKMRWIRNRALGKQFEFVNTDYKQYNPDPWESKHELIWYLDPKTTPIRDKVWAFKLTPVGRPAFDIIDMGYVLPKIPKDLDVVFISYHEPNAEQNWQRLLKFAPNARRLHGVKGIFEAHKLAAHLATTELFYVVDGDAWIVDDFKFNHNTDIFDRDCTYIWLSQNPFNDLEYGYGGVKLFSRHRLLKTRKWSTLDLSTTISQHVKVMDKVSNITRFNTDPYSTWRSAFREAVKLTQNGDDYKLTNWVVKTDVENSKWAELGIRHGIEFQEQNQGIKLNKINDPDWLKKYFITKTEHD